MRSVVLSVVLAAIGLASCREPDRPTVPLPGGDFALDSDPAGAEILIDNEPTGLVTPDTVRELTEGTYDVRMTLDTAGYSYFYLLMNVPAPPKDSVRTIVGPLLLPCGATCGSWSVFHEFAGVRFAASAAGTLFYRGGAGNGVQWPEDRQNSYASVGVPAFAAVVEGTDDTVAIGPYDTSYLYGRPAPELIVDATGTRLRRTAWVVPPLPTLATARGIELEQEIIGTALADVLFVRTVFRNITHLPLYRTADPGVPEGGLTYSPMHVGFLLDGDVAATSVANAATDDNVSYVPDLDLIFTYDQDFAEPGFTSDWAERPALIGLQMVSAPAGTTTHLNAWVQRVAAGTVDWQAGRTSESFGWYWMTATNGLLGNHADARIGYAPSQTTELNDYRMLVSAGPVTLAPGDSVAVVVAVILAEPEPGTFTSGTAIAPGDPFDTGRAIHAVAARLRQKAEQTAGMVQ